MCGIFATVAQRQASALILEGLRRLEYRGYDSAGVALLAPDSGELQWVRRVGKIAVLEEALRERPLSGSVGIGHTRWATHGEPVEANAHPHCAGDLALVHNGIIENHQQLREEIDQDKLTSSTDSEVIAWLLWQRLEAGEGLLEAMRSTLPRLKGAYSMAVLRSSEPETLVVVRHGSPLVVGLGIGENFVASDVIALRQVTDRYIFLEEGDIAALQADALVIYDAHGNLANRPVVTGLEEIELAERGDYRHHMEKEIYEQPAAVAATLESVWDGRRFDLGCYGAGAEQIFAQLKSVHLVACGTSFHTAQIARHWIETLAGVPCSAEIASEFRYRDVPVPPQTLLVAISQSGETADTLAVMRANRDGYLARLAVTNISTSSLVREADLVFVTRAGMEIGVASTKAFTTQMVGMLLFALALARTRGLDPERERELLIGLTEMPDLMRAVLADAPQLEVSQMAAELEHRDNALFLGRGLMYPLAQEGALKLKELSYIHAEAYAAGELKHGPLALVDEDIPVIVVAPQDSLLSKLESNLEEVRARGGQLYLICDEQVAADRAHTVHMPQVDALLAPLLYTIPLQLLAYQVALLRGTDIDQPRNLAKSVTVE